MKAISVRVAYIANYQGESLVNKRPCLHNFSLAARVKIQLVAELLRKSSHEVEVFSQGQLEPQIGINRYRVRYFPGFEDPVAIDSAIPIRYASALSLRYVTGFWEDFAARRLLHQRHRERPFDLVFLYNLQRAQLGCAFHASRRLRLPVVLQYEDDAFVDIHGNVSTGYTSDYYRRLCREALGLIAGGTGVSPHLLSQMPSRIPKLLLRGVVSQELRDNARQSGHERKNWVVFSGTHEGTQGLEQLVSGWRRLSAPDWQLHIAGHGPLTSTLKKLAADDERVVFHGLLNRAENARLLCQARIGLNPQDLTKVPGSVFAFKIVEYLAAGLHVITTPRGAVESELEKGITYIPDNGAETIGSCLDAVIRERRFMHNAQDAALRTYGPDAIAGSLNQLLEQVVPRQ